jgi:hypothetical protein
VYLKYSLEPLQIPNLHFFYFTASHTIFYKVSHMRIPKFPTIVRSFYTLSNYSARVSAQTSYKTLHPFSRGTVLKSMPTIPFPSRFFSSSSSTKMSYPLEKSNDEWQAVLNKGIVPRHSLSLNSH